MIIFFSFIIAMFVTMVLIPPLMNSAERWHFVDVPDARKTHRDPIPCIGGIAMVIGALLPVLIWLPDERPIIGYLIGAGTIVAFGVWDDRRPLNYRIKFLGQLIAAAVVIFYGGVEVTLVPFGSYDGLPHFLAIPFTAFAILGITNAINLADGLDGLAGGTTLLSFTAIGLLAFLAGDTAVLLISLAVMGSIIGFLRFNTYPARIFMGDGGSQFLGFSVSVLTIMLTQDVNPALSPALPLMLLGLPILDTFLVIGQRIQEGRSPFKPDQNHIHHKLLALGFDHYEAVTIIYLAQAILVTSAYLLRYQSDALIVGLYLAFCAAVVGFFSLAQRGTWRVHNGIEKRSFLSEKVRWLRREDVIGNTAYVFAIGTVPVYFVAGAFGITAVEPDVGYLSVGLLAVLLMLFPWQRGKPFNLAERAGLYITSSIVIYLVQSTTGLSALAGGFINGFFVLLAVAVVLGFRFSKDRSFRVTPLDFLVVFIALIVPNLPGTDLERPWISETIAKMIVIFYACELVLMKLKEKANTMRYVMFITLAIICMRGLAAW